MKTLIRFAPVVGFCFLGGLVMVRTHWVAAYASPQQPLSTPAAQQSSKDESVTKSETTKSIETPIVAWQKIKEEAPSWLSRQSSDEVTRKMEEAIRDRLQQRMDISVNEKPLSDFFKVVSEEINVTIWIDVNALEVEGISPDEPVTLELSNAKCSNILGLVLDTLELTYKIDRELIMITTGKAAANTARFYDLSHVLPDNSMTEELIQLIEITVVPDRWVNAGGTSTMQVFGSMLVASAPESTHLQIEELIRNVAKQSPNNMRPRRKTNQSIKGMGMMGGQGGMMSVEKQ